MAEQVTLTLPDDIAQRVRDVATSTQRDLEDVLLEWIDRSSRPQPLPNASETTEIKLLQQINLGFSANWWTRYQSLIVERQAETISDPDLAELIEKSEALEVANVKRVQALGELAQLRGCSIEQVMAALDIGTTTEADV